MNTISKISLFLLISVSSIISAGGLLTKIKEPIKVNPADKLPLVFHKNYDISLFGLEKLHPFDSCKYGKVHNYLITHGIDSYRFITPKKVSDQDLLLVHTQEYLDSLKNSSVVASIAELPFLSYVPNFILQKCLLKPAQLATGGTVHGAQVALLQGWAINISGGYHHAKRESCGGFCFYADIPLAILKVFEKHPDYKVMIVDLDAHQGNGHESFFEGDLRVAIFDIYNKNIYPRDYEARKRIDFNYPVASGIKDEQYLSILRNNLPRDIDTANPDLIIYNAGTDIFEEDALGSMKISAQGIIERDQFVFKTALEKNIPILMVLSGGYNKKSAEIIGRSIENICKNIIGCIF